eukprot:gene20-221_t
MFRACCRASLLVFFCLSPALALFRRVTGEVAYSNLGSIHGAQERQTLVTREDGPHEQYEAKTDPKGPKPVWVDNPLAEFFFAYTEGYKIWKWHHYFRVYHRHLSPFLAYKDQPGVRLNMLVIGVQSGGEIGLWQSYFGSNFHFYGIDINPACKQLEQAYERTKIFVGDQGDTNFLLQVKDEIVKEGGVIHMILDDGSHINWHQIISFETLYPWLHGYGGVYIVEDATTSYGPPTSVHRAAAPQLAHVAGVVSPQETLVDHMKNRVDFVNGYWKFPKAQAQNDAFVASVQSIAFYDAMVLVEKFPHEHAMQEQRGTIDIPYCTPGQLNGCHTEDEPGCVALAGLFRLRGSSVSLVPRQPGFSALA